MTTGPPAGQVLWTHKLLTSPFSLGMCKEKPSPFWSSSGQALPVLCLTGAA